MTKNVHIIAPNQTVREAAARMAEIDAGALPVAESDRLIGMITDRDIAVRGVAQGKGPETPVRDVMSAEVCYCFEDQELDEVAANMADVKTGASPSSTATSAWRVSSRWPTSPLLMTRTKPLPPRCAGFRSPEENTRKPTVAPEKGMS
jgi:CBS domain-containing protein